MCGHGEAEKFLAENRIAEKIKIIDLSQDFRLLNKAAIGNRTFVYGLPELNKEEIQHCKKYCQPRLFCYSYSIRFIAIGKSRIIE